MTEASSHRPTTRRYMDFAPKRTATPRPAKAPAQRIITTQSVTTTQRIVRPVAPSPKPPAPQPKAPEPDFGVIEDYRPKAPTPSKPSDNDAPDANQYALGGRSPFLSSVMVDKRPLSPSAPSGTPKTPEDIQQRKNVYRKAATKAAKASAARTAVVPAAKDQSRLPMIALIILTVLLGAAVGAATYFCIFQY